MIGILLPPSETKHPGGRGRPLGARAPHPQFGAARATVLDALDAALVRADVADALLLPPAVRDAALAANARVRTSGTLPALRRYAGTVYDGLDYAHLDPAVQRLAHRCVHIFSGLFGVVRGDEPVPDYRVPAKAVLPGVGVCGTFWRPTLERELPALLGRRLIVDLRSSDYAAMWRPDRSLAGRVVTVRVLSPTPSGKLAVVSYNSKFAKGRLAAALLQREVAGQPVRGADDVADAWRATGGRASVTERTGHQVELYTAP